MGERGSNPRDALPAPIDTDPRHVVAVSGLFADAAGRIVLVRPEGRGWELPGGRVEEGEGLIEAMLREAREESGCDVRVERLVGVETRISPPQMILFTFRGVHVAGEPTAGYEILEAGWFSVEDALTLVDAPAQAMRLRVALAPGPRPRVWVYRAPPFEVLDERTL